MRSKNASKSFEDQRASLQKLNLIEDQTETVRGVVASILGYLVHGRRPQETHTDSLDSLQDDLVKAAYEARYDEEQSKPADIYLTPRERLSAQEFFIASFQYEGITDRESRIAVAHESTFQWVLHDVQSRDHQSQAHRWSNFAKWLVSDEQLYWITGKAGSGKSTLMKFLTSPLENVQDLDGTRKSPIHQSAQWRSRCHPFLEDNAGLTKLVVASFYFWNSGADLQMTQIGLFRTLMHQFLSQRPDIIPLVMPQSWEAVCFFGNSKFLGLASAQDLRHLLHKAINVLSKDSKICLFIDGLDEFCHNHNELIAMVLDLVSSNRNVKLCVASRPWNIFQDALGHVANLRLEDLTFDDIKSFVHSRFSDHTDFGRLQQRYPSFAEQLIENIVVKASGVFLWVDLVVTSLLAGMQKGDRIQDLQRRLDDLPSDLENLYEKILQSLDEFYLEHAAQYFILMELAENPLTILQFSFADEETPESAMRMYLGSLTPDEVSLRVTDMNRRLNSRCKGFLETDRGFENRRTNGIGSCALVNVQYLHRTVKDFIKSPKTQAFVQSVIKTEFDPSLQLCLAYLMAVKASYNHPNDHTPQMASDVIHCLRHSGGVSEENEKVSTELVHNLKNIVEAPGSQGLLIEDILGDQKLFTVAESEQRPSSSGENASKTATDPIASNTIDGYFLSLAVKYRAIPYVRSKASRGALVPRRLNENITQDYGKNCWPLLLDALSNMVPDPEMVALLLDLGADPNYEKDLMKPPWQVALNGMEEYYGEIKNRKNPTDFLLDCAKWRQTMKLLYSRRTGNWVRGGVGIPDITKKVLRELDNEVSVKFKLWGMSSTRSFFFRGSFSRRSFSRRKLIPWKLVRRTAE